MKTFLLLITTLVAHHLAVAQTIPTFCVSYGTPYFDRNQCGVATFDGGYAAAGISFTYALYQDNYIVKFDAAGNVLWSDVTGSDMVDDFFGITETSDHHLIVVGLRDHKMIVMKYDVDGNIIWSKQIAIQSYAELSDVIETSDGSYLLTGDTRDDATGWSYCSVIKIDSDGNLLWNKNFYDFYRAEAGYTCVETADKRYVIGLYSAAFSNAFMIISMDEDGTVQWVKKSDYSGVAYDMVATSDSSVVIAGYVCLTSNCDPLLTKMASDGNVEWSYTYGDSLFERFYSIVKLPDGSFAVGGDATDQTSIFHGYTIKCDDEGQLQWSNTDDEIEIRSIGISPDGGLLVSSTSTSNVSDFGLRKMDINGGTCPQCPVASYGIQQSGTSFTDISLSEFNATAVISDVALDEPNSTGTLSVYCSEVGIEENEKENFSLTIFPNPASENFQITIPQNFSAEKIFISDVNGKIIYSHSLFPKTKLSFDVSSFPNGIYSVQLFFENKMTSAKLAVVQ